MNARNVRGRGQSRLGLIEQLRRRLNRQSYPRLQMLLIVSLTAGSGFLASSLFLHLGLQAMGPRYLLACMTAYLVFLLLLWIWLRSQASDLLDIPNVNFSSSHRNAFEGSGGQSAGGGASASYDVEDSPADTLGVGDAFSAAGDADEFAIPLFLILAALALVMSSLFVVWSAPVLFAELMVDGVLAASLYRRLRGLDTTHWLETAIRRTFWPFFATTLIVTSIGFGIQHFSPKITTVGEMIGMHVDVIRDSSAESVLTRLTTVGSTGID